MNNTSKNISTLVVVAAAAILAVALLLTACRTKETIEPAYEFVTLSGEVKRGWCNEKAVAPICQAENNNWYSVKEYEKLNQ